MNKQQMAYSAGWKMAMAGKLVQPEFKKDEHSAKVALETAKGVLSSLVESAKYCEENDIEGEGLPSGAYQGMLDSVNEALQELR